MKIIFNVFILLSLLCSTFTFANTKHIGIIIKASGDTFVLRQEKDLAPIKRRDKIYEGDQIVTHSNSTIQIRFIDKAMLALRENSEIIIEQYHSNQGEQEEKVLMELLSGGFRTITGNFGKASEDGYEVSTPAASIGIRGTDYEAVLGADGGLALGVWSGGISVENPNGSIDLGSDTGFNFGTVKKDSAPKGSLTPPDSLSQKVEKVEEKDEEEDTEEESEETDEAQNEEESSEEAEESSEESEDEKDESQSDSDEQKEEESEDDTSSQEQKDSETNEQNESEESESEETSNLSNESNSNDDQSENTSSNEGEQSQSSNDSQNTQQPIEEPNTSPTQEPQTNTTPTPNPNLETVIPEISVLENSIEETIQEIIETELEPEIGEEGDPGDGDGGGTLITSDRLTQEQIEQITEKPNVGLLFLIPEQRPDIFTPTLESNIEAQVQDFSQGVTTAQIVSDNPWPIIPIENGRYVTESLTIEYQDLNIEVSLIDNTSTELINSIQMQIDEQAGTDSLSVYLNDNGLLIFEANNTESDVYFKIDTSNASVFSQDIGLTNTTASSHQFDNKITFNILVEENNVAYSHQIVLDKNHNSVDDLIADIKDDLEGANINIQSTDQGIAFTLNNTSSDNSITITDVVGENDAHWRLTQALGGITENQISSIAYEDNQNNIHFGYMLENSDGTVTFITYPDEKTDVLNDQYIEPEFILNGGNAANLTRFENVGGFENINWGYWNNTSENPATLTSSDSSDNNGETQYFNEKFFFLDATPADTGSLVGQKSFSSNGEFLGSSNAGEVNNVTGSMQVDFSTAQLTGNLSIEAGNSQTWDMQYSGQVQDSTVQMNDVWGQATFDDGTTQNASGDMGGIFAEPGNIYVGGFNIQTVNNPDNYVDGVYMMEEDSEK